MKPESVQRMRPHTLLLVAWTMGCAEQTMRAPRPVLLKRAPLTACELGHSADYVGFFDVERVAPNASVVDQWSPTTLRLAELAIAKPENATHEVTSRAAVQTLSNASVGHRLEATLAFPVGSEIRPNSRVLVFLAHMSDTNLWMDYNAQGVFVSTETGFQNNLLYDPTNPIKRDDLLSEALRGSRLRDERCFVEPVTQGPDAGADRLPDGGSR